MKKYSKFISISNFKRLLLLLVLLLTYTFVCAFSYVNAVSTNIQDSVFRLHVIANSDSDADQNLKYIVRDKVINYIKEISKTASSKDKIIEIAKNNLEEIENIAMQTIYEQGYNYSIQVNIGNFAFPSKQYGDITLPPGYYDALKIEIGEASGQNWWCVMFPPLCFVDVTSGIVPDESKEIMKHSMQEEEYELISEANTELKIKFKIVEVLQNFNISGIFM